MPEKIFMKKVVLPREEDGFKIYEHSFCNIPSYLIIPQADAKWTKDNLYFRSMIVDKEYKEVLSVGWPKFFNFGENPNCYPNPENYKDWKIEEKLDGSLVICDCVENVFSMRTRGCVSYITQQNAEDFKLLPLKYPQVVEFLKVYPHISLLFEIITPNNVIVIRPSDVEFYFLGAVDKFSLQVATEEGYQKIANILHVPIPKTYSFKSLIELKQAVEKWKGKEGVVLSYNNNQNRIKMKSDWYCWIHKIKSQLNSENNLIEFYVNEGLPDYEKFYNIIKNNFDWELAEQMKSEISKLCDAKEKVLKIKNGMVSFVNTIKNYKTRKEQAQAVIESYGNTNRTSMVFNLLDGKKLSNEQLIKLMHQSL